MISCREATLLISRRLDGPLSRRERAALRLHLMICRFCARFQRQAAALHRMFRRSGGLAETLAERDGDGLDAAARARIAARLREASGAPRERR